MMLPVGELSGKGGTLLSALLCLKKDPLLSSNIARKRNLIAGIALIYIELTRVRKKEVPMIIFAAIVVLIIVAIACVGLVCASFDADDLRNMGIRL